MMTFGDVSWCSRSWTDCDGSCNRKFTEDYHKKAVEWWGNDGYPLCMVDFHTEPESITKLDSLVESKLK